MSEFKAFTEPLKSSDYYIQLFDQLPSLMWRSGKDGTCNWFNTKWLSFTGRILEEEVGNGWADGVHPEDYDRCVNFYNDNFQSKQPFEMEYRLKHHSGEYRWIKDIGQPFNDENGEFAGFLGTCYDIHSGRSAEEDLKKLNDHLEEIVRERTFELTKNYQDLKKTNYDLDSFIYTASHDLKSPISNIEGLMGALEEMLDDKKDNVAIWEILKMIELSIRKFKNTITDLADITKVQKNIEDDVDNVVIKQTVDEVQLLIADLINKNDAKITMELDGCETLKFSRVNFRSIISNLLTNAIKYRSPLRSPEILIKCEVGKEGTTFLIKDNGLGIKQASIEKMFTMFKRFHDHVEGTGIGLYMVKRMVENAGGTITVESEVDKGSTFKLFFPNSSI